MHASMHTSGCACVIVCIQVGVRACMYAYRWVCMCDCMHTGVCVRDCMHTGGCACVIVCIQVGVRACMYACRW